MYHIIIQEELCAVLDQTEGITDLRPPRKLATEYKGQLHMISERLDNKNDANILYAAEWDGRSPWLIVHKGAIADIKMAYMGWPMIDEETWEKENESELLQIR